MMYTKKYFLFFGLSVIIAAQSTILNAQVKFRVPTSVDVPESPYELAKGDFNNDGLPDLVTANFSSLINKQITVLLNTGTGTFTGTNLKNFGASTGIIDVGVGDFNEDGKLDVVACSNSNNNFSLLLGDGTGNLAAAVDFASGDQPYGLAVGDMNKDNNLDVLISHRGTPDDVYIFLGNGAGGFAAPSTLAIPTNTAWDITVADFDGDTNPDFALSTAGVYTLQIWKGNGSGTSFTNIQTITGFVNNPNVDAVDLDGDGDMDLLASGGYTLNNGTGTFGPRVLLPQTEEEYAVGDFNKDGHPDIVGSDDSENTPNARIFLGDGLGNFTLLAKFEMFSFALGLEVLDVNNDSELDVVGAGSWSGDGRVDILLGDGTGYFTNSVTKYPTQTGPSDLITGDFNEDGLIDAALCHDSGNLVTIYLGQANGRFAKTATNYTTGAAPDQLLKLDYNKDGHIDLVTFNLSALSLTLLAGAGDGSFTVQTNIPVAGAPGSRITTADFNKDTNPDIAVSGGPNKNISILLGTGTGFNSPTTFSVSENVSEIKAADFTGDGNPDIIVNFYDIIRMVLLTGNGSGGFTESTTQYPARCSYFLIEDLNNDTKPDVIAFANNDNGDDFFVNDGAGNFTGSAIIVSLGGNAWGYADMNGDGFKDLVVGSQNSNSSQPGQIVIFKGTASGITNNVLIDKDYSGGNRLELHELNGDGKMDIMATSYSMYEGYLGVLINDTGAAACTSPSGTITPSSTVCAGQNVTLTVTASGTAPFTYQWKKGGVNISGATSSTLNFASVAAGDAASYTCTITNGCGNFTTSASVLTVQTSLTPPTATGSSSCVASTLTLTASGGVNGQYRWYDVSSGGTAIAGQVNSSYTTPVLSVSKTFYVSINNGTCESARTAVDATIAPLGKPIISATQSIVGGVVNICDDQDVNLTGPNGFAEYNWSNGQTSQQITISTAGTFTLTVKDAGGCVSPPSDLVTVVVNPYPPAEIEVNGNVLTASSGDSYLWYQNGDAVSSATNQTYEFNPLEYGVYHVAVTENGCTTSSAAFTYLITESETDTQSWKVFPNPFTRELTILSPSELDVEIEITDVLGRRWRKERIPTNTPLLLDNLQDGHYILFVYTATKKLPFRISKTP